MMIRILNPSRRLITALGSLLIGIFIVVGILSCKSDFTPQQGWNKSYGPVVPHDKFPADCSTCHTGKDWTTIKQDFTFDHQNKTHFPLDGAHKQVECLMCHNDRGPAEVFAAKGCAGCHVDPHRTTLGRLCADCHIESSWKPKAQIAKHNLTRFPLTGAHASVACFACHPGSLVGNFKGNDPTCLTCHQSDLKKAVLPNHVVQGWTADCQKCHTAVAWKPALFKHTAVFPLTGGHAGLTCEQCHKTSVFTFLPTDCASCHLKDFQKTKSPNHTAAGFSTDCTTCHTIKTWQNARFTHTALFPLTGGHAGVSCTSCHKNNVFLGTSTECVSCHISDYQKVKSPNHIAAGFGTDCVTCHSMKTWLNAKFSHFSFPITSGPHKLACIECHKNTNNFIQFDCITCHKQGETNSEHKSVKNYRWVSSACLSCHPGG